MDSEQNLQNRYWPTLLQGTESELPTRICVREIGGKRGREKERVREGSERERERERRGEIKCNVCVHIFLQNRF